MKRINLIHPIYLDVPMLVSFAAAIEGGVSFTSEVTQREGNKQHAESKAAARFGLSKLFSSFVDFGGSMSGASTDGHESQSIEKTSRSHTEASLAILLYERLEEDPDYIVRPRTADDIAKLASGTLVELSGTVSKNAVDSVIEYIDIASNMSRMADVSKQGQQKKGSQPQDQLSFIRTVLDTDRKRTPISNVMLRCEVPAITAVVTLRTENLRDLTMSELHRSNVRVLGKALRVLREGESMSTFENYGLSLLHKKDIDALFDSLTNQEGLRMVFSDREVKGPTVQVLPLMVFV